jgi:hypothetical protein
MRNFFGLIFLVICTSEIYSFTDYPDVVGKGKVKTYIIYDPVIWPDHWETSKHTWFKPGIKYGLGDAFEFNGNITFYELGFYEYFISLKYKLPYSTDKWLHSIALTFNHMPNQDLENMANDYGWASPFQEPSTKRYYRSWNSHLQYHLGYKINDIITLSINIGIQYWSSIGVDTSWESGNSGFAPAFSFPAIHINFNPKTSMTLSYGDGDSGDLGFISVAYIWN